MWGKGVGVSCCIHAALTPPPPTVHPAMDDRRSPCSLARLPHSKGVFQLLQGSTVLPSLAPDKTSARLGHSLSSPDRVACNTNIFHRGGRKMDSDIPHFASKFDVLPPCPTNRYRPCPDIRCHVFVFLILENPPRLCGKCIAPASL